MHLVLDIGNTTVKAGWFEHENLLHNSRFMPEKVPDFSLPDYGYPRQVFMASVRDSDPDFILDFQCPVIKFTSQTPLPIRNLYSTPQSLGADRLANAVAGWRRFPQEDVLIIDAGTCLKLDLVLRNGTYIGGSIAPGLNMRYRAMHEFTGKLPQLAPASSAALTGNDTNSSMHSGAINGMCAEIDGMIERYKIDYPHLRCLLTGGDHPVFYDKLKCSIFANPTLTLEGLNTILLYLK